MRRGALTVLRLLLLLLLSIPTMAQQEEPQVRYIEVEPEEEPPEPERYLDKAIDPETYIVGPGDRFLVTFYGADYDPVKLEILPEGVVAIPSIGEVYLGQISLAGAKEKIKTEIRSRFRVESVGVSLLTLRMFKVNVTGGVNKPGVVVVSASDRVSDALVQAGGPVESASQRNIRLIQSAGDTAFADLIYFNATGELSCNPYLHEGQVIHVPVVSDSLNTVEIYGAVNRAGVFEYKRGDRISDLLALGFGPEVNADLEHALLLRFVERGDSNVSRTIDLRPVVKNPDVPENLLLQPDDRLFLRAIAEYRRKEKASIAGEVRYPGDYPIERGCRTVSELVERAGGLLPTASLAEAEMYRQSRWTAQDKTSFDQLLQLTPDKLTDFELEYLKTSSSGQDRKVAVDFYSLLEQGKEEFDLPLRDGDRVSIPPKSFTVTVLGRVAHPGQVSYTEGKGVNHYIRLAGGYGYKADRDNIRIIKSSTGALVKPEDDQPVQMGDRIMVPQTKEIDWWGVIKDAGIFLANVATIYVVIERALE
jgi:protein involved in polysaccharide export with SLBB domain